jgi:hypothetical protein
MLALPRLAAMVPFFAYLLAATGVPAQDTAHTARALSLQRQLQLDTPLERTSWLGAHNAWNDSGAVWANQRWSMQMLLEKGIRAVDLDVHRDSDGSVKLCHGQCDQFYSAEDSYEGELGKIAAFVQARPHEIVIIDLEDRVGHQADVTTPLAWTFGNLLFRPSDKPAGRWMTPREMIDRGKRVLVKSANHTYDGSLIWQAHLFAHGAAAGWNYRPVKDVDSGNCTLDGQPITQPRFYGVMDNKVGLETGRIDAANIPALMRCGVDIVDADRWSDGMLAAAVWTWAAGEPNNAGGDEDCVMQQGRWNDLPCSRSLRYACRRPSAPDTMLVTAAAGPWSEGEARCAAEHPGSRFAVPQNAHQNTRLSTASNAAVWIAVSDATLEGRWDVRERR